MTDPKVCSSPKSSGLKSREAKTHLQALSSSATANAQEAPMEKVRADCSAQVASRSEKKGMVLGERETEETASTDKKGLEADSADNAENSHPYELERANSATDGQEEVADETAAAGIGQTASAKTPFTSLSQVDADLALARVLQEQERAYMLLRMGGDTSDFDSSGSGSYNGEGEDDYEDDFDGEEPVEGTRELDGTLYEDDEAYARALQDKEDRETTAMLALAGIQVQGLHDWEVAEYESESEASQDMWQEMDPDNMSYEELVALGEAVGTQNKGLASEAISALPTSSYVTDKRSSGCGTEQCVICRLEYEEGDSLSTLPCKHLYHTDCIQQWLEINKVCPVCNKEVTVLGNSDKTPGAAAAAS
ncbi:hypothetical protein R1flu_016210 [Riccia fluitans]|uniref:RING-type domain-containing protein n=1 Tax=Riccia fluitans TaxID=41844 RepID=A0ABD1YPC0_9MARC